VSNGTAILREALDTPQSRLCQQQAVRVTSLAAPIVLARFRTAAGGPVARLYLTAKRELAVRSDVTGTQRITTTRVPLGEWHTVRLCGTVGPTGTWEAYYDGTRVLSWSVDTGTAAVGQVQVGDDGKTTAVLNVDDVLVSVP
jgi:hypothetical protein